MTKQKKNGAAQEDVTKRVRLKGVTERKGEDVVSEAMKRYGLAGAWADSGIKTLTLHLTVEQPDPEGFSLLNNTVQVTYRDGRPDEMLDLTLSSDEPSEDWVEAFNYAAEDRDGEALVWNAITGEREPGGGMSRQG